MKYVAVALIVAGVAAFGLGYTMDKTGSYSDGSFMLEMTLGTAGVILIVVGILLYAGAAWLGI